MQIPAGHVPTAEAAKRLGVTRRKVHQLIEDGRLRSKKVGRFTFVEESTVAAFKRLSNPAGVGLEWRP